MVGIIAVSSYGHGFIRLDNYITGTYPLITYGIFRAVDGSFVPVPANGVNGLLGSPGDGLSSEWTVGLYWVSGATGLSQPAGWDMPDAALILGTGIGSTEVMHRMPLVLGSIHPFLLGTVDQR